MKLSKKNKKNSRLATTGKQAGKTAEYLQTNNFRRIKDIPTKLLYGTAPKNPVFLTIILITYKRFWYFTEAVASILKQKKADFTWDVVIMDNDADFENTEKQIYLSSLNCKRIRYYKNTENLGHEGNINRGAQLTDAVWISILHDDDLLVGNYLQLISQYIKACADFQKPLAYIRPRHLYFKDRSEITRDCFAAKIEQQRWIRPLTMAECLVKGCGPTYINSCGTLIRRDVFMEAGGYNRAYDPIGDAVFGLALMENYTIIASGRVLGFYRRSLGTSMKKETMQKLLQADYDLRKYFYSLSTAGRIFGKIFCTTQFTLSAARMQKNAELAGFVLSREEIEKTGKLDQGVILAFLKKELLRGIWILVMLRVNPSQLVWREKWIA